MIAALTGNLLRSTVGEAVLDVNGVGYRVFLPLSTYSRLPSLGEPVSLRIVTIVKEDEIALYGFFTEREEWLFNLLRDVSGVGPKLSAKVLSGLEPGRLRDALGGGDVTTLCTIPGVGKKLAQRLIVELREKVGAFDSGAAYAETPLPAGPVSEAVEALIALGYPRPVAKRAVEGVFSPDAGVTVEELIRLSLRALAPRR
ncbi:Holliday junction branch migration protein RuvA [bacterium]|nr:MAG: Holliday junction branch migration protein RuvA [bacterium]